MSESLTRRSVLRGAAALAGVAALPRLFAGYPAISHVVLDERLAHAAEFLSGWHGARVHWVSALDDLCNRWYTRLRSEVLASAGPVAGATTWMDYVVMRSCAAEIAYVGVSHAEHPPGAAGLKMVSWVFSPRS